ncbi:MAG TPA: EamA family transporter [Verrucomicrobiae bacterium]
MTKLLLILFFGLTFETMGVVLLSKGLKQLDSPKNYGPAELVRMVRRALSSKEILLGVAFEAVFFICLLVMMSRADVSFVWPLTALTFVFSTLAARFYLREDIDGLRWAGVVLIVLGAGLITFTEKRKQNDPSRVPSSEYPRI